MVTKKHLHWLLLMVGSVCFVSNLHTAFALLDSALDGEEIEENHTATTSDSSSISSSASMAEGSMAEGDNTQNQRKEEEKKLWGAAKPLEHGTQHHAESSSSTSSASEPSTQHQHEHVNDKNPSPLPVGGISSSTSHSIPYQYEPPKGFEITARVYTDPEDKLAHFDNDGSIVFPYWECGVSGSSTVPIPLQHATVRHLLGGTKPNLYSGEEFGPHPQLVIALTSIEVLLNSGQVQTFAPGDVLLLEDVVSGGHKIKGSGQSDMTVMILTLPDHYHQVGKDKHSLQRILAKTTNPCPDDGWDMTTKSKEEASIPEKISQALHTLQPRSIRRYVLGMVGLSISTLMGDFMGKVAPLWLAVVFGGGCFVTGGTYCFVKVGDYCLDELEMWQERRQLKIREDSNGGGDEVDGISSIEKNMEELLEKKEQRS